MDILAHGLWGGVAFYPQGTKKYSVAFVLGMAPDLLSFGLYHAIHPKWLMLRLAGETSGPPPLSTLPEFLFHAYNLTHSFAIWATLFALVWIIRRNPPWTLLAWGLHILCDILTHNSRYFPTPYLWPLPTPFVEGTSWAAPWFMITNYTALLVVYGVTFLYVGKKGKHRLGAIRPSKVWRKIGRAVKRNCPTLLASGKIAFKGL